MQVFKNSGILGHFYPISSNSTFTLLLKVTDWCHESHIRIVFDDRKVLQYVFNFVFGHVTLLYIVPTRGRNCRYIHNWAETSAYSNLYSTGCSIELFGKGTPLNPRYCRTLVHSKRLGPSCGSFLAGSMLSTGWYFRHIHFDRRLLVDPVSLPGLFRHS